MNYTKSYLSENLNLWNLIHRKERLIRARQVAKEEEMTVVAVEGGGNGGGDDLLHITNE